MFNKLKLRIRFRLAWLSQKIAPCKHPNLVTFTVGGKIHSKACPECCLYESHHD